MPRVLVAGGSLGGLTSALVLRDLGCNVHVFERSASPLEGYGAGIVVHDMTVRYLRERMTIELEQISAPSTYMRYLLADGSVEYEEPSTYRFTAWNTLYRRLLGGLGEERYHRGEALVGIDQDEDEVEVRFASGRVERCGLLVCADGISSTARQRLLGPVEPCYSGYVAWRGTVGEAELGEETFGVLCQAITFAVVPGSHFVAYPIPSVEGSLAQGSRLVNYVWYRNVAAGSDLDELMTDRLGFKQSISLHPGAVQQRYVDELKAAARTTLPGPLAEPVAKTPQPFIQVIVDLEVPRMAFGRMCLIGDAAFAARPHAAAGTAKAAANGWALAEALERSRGDVITALSAWEPGQLELGRRLVARAQVMGDRSQVHGTWRPDDVSLRFGLYGPGN
jgi:2,6-dihydroxypyridine 3-monooxygenase